MSEHPRMFDREMSSLTDSDGDLISNKHLLQCITAHNCRTKKKTEIENHNEMHWLRVDSDEDSYTIDELSSALIDCGINTFVIHTSWSHKPSYSKLKALIPLFESMPCVEWENVQARLTERLKTDVCMDNMTQVSYEPASYPGHAYDYLIVENGRHDFNSIPELPEKPVEAVREVVRAGGNEDSIIAEYNARFDWSFELQASGYKKKGNRYLSPTATSKIAGGSLFKADCGKVLFHTHHTSDPIHALGAVDGFGFTCLMEGIEPVDLVLQLATGELKDWNKKKQKEYAEAKEQVNQFSDENINKFAEMFQSQNKEPEPTMNGGSFFGDIKPTGEFVMPPETALDKVMKTVQFAPKNNQPVKTESTTPDYVFPTPVDDTINLYEATGTVGDCINYINNSSRKPRRILAVSGALSTVGMIGGLSHEDESFGATSNLFCFNIAESGTGKENVLQCIDKIIAESGFKNSVFGKIKSEQEIYRNLINSQAVYYNIDEIGEVLGKITGSTDSYMTGIIGTLMSIYSKASGNINLGGDEITEIKNSINKIIQRIEKKREENEISDEVADQQLEKLQEFYGHLERGVLVNPYLAISGCTTQGLFSKIATKQNVLSGFIGRSLMFKEHDDVPRANRFYKKSEFPLDLAHELKKIRNCGNQKLNEHGRTQNYGSKEPIKTSKKALEWLYALQYNIETKAKEHARTDGMHPLINRQFELVLKVSMILAIGDGKVRTLEHVKWAQYLVSRDVETKIDLVRGNDEDEAKEPIEIIEDFTSKIIKFLTEKQDSFLPSRISQFFRGLDTKTTVKILTVLVQKGVVETVEEKGKKPKFKIAGS